LSERDDWVAENSIKRGGKYFFTRNGTTVIAFMVGGEFPVSAGAYTVLGAHTDSPCLKIKPVR
jgi:aspartyl aminopeptidase